MMEKVSLGIYTEIIREKKSTNYFHLAVFTVEG